MKRCLFLIAFSFVLMNIFFVPDVWALTMGPLPEIKSDDRVLILAPHPDDESIGAGGVIQKAVSVGAKVRVVLLTNGENNELSFLVYKKRPVLRSKELVAMGHLRRQESLAAVSSLGLTEQDVISLGYPDFGTMDILTGYWGDVRPFRSMLSRVRAVPYENALSPGADYVGDNILRDIKSVLYDFKPTKIFVSHPVDTNRDHRALYLFLRLALWDVGQDFAVPAVYPYLIHVAGWPKPRGYRPELVLSVPRDLENGAITWFYLGLTGAEVQKKSLAIGQYASQNKCAPRYLVTFARLNELFGDYPPVAVSKQLASEVFWSYVGTGDEILPGGQSSQPEDISGLAYARRGSDLLVKIDLRRKVAEEVGVTVFLLGYSATTPFSQMPKISLDVSSGVLTVRNGRKRLPAKEVFFEEKEKELLFQVPMELLGHPDRILTSAKSSRYNLTLDETAWRVLEIKSVAGSH